MRRYVSLDDDREDTWTSEYAYGYSQEIRSVVFTERLAGDTFSEAAWVIYVETGAMLIAVRMMHMVRDVAGRLGRCRAGVLFVGVGWRKGGFRLLSSE